jgi:phage terminase small subunit
MFRRLFLTCSLASLGAGCLMADFSYEQTSKITGGMMAGMMKIAGAFSKQAREPMVSSVLVKGDRMANVNQHSIKVIDLQRETITDIDTQKKQYSVMTFADMAKAMERLQEKAAQKAQKSGDPGAQMEFKANVNQTGATKMISGMNAKQTILTLEMQGTDTKSGQKGGFEVVTDMWLAPAIAGYEEVRNFHRRMAEKIAWNAAGSGMIGALAQDPKMMKGMAEISKQASKIDGVPVMQIIRMGAKAEGMDMAAANTGTPQEQQPQAPPPTVGQAAGNAAGSAAANAAGRKIGGLGGLAVGGLGGFGGMRKKKAEQESPPPQAPPPTQAAPQAAPTGNASGVLIEMTTELTSLSSGPVDPSKFEVPAGFKKVDSELEKALH